MSIEADIDAVYKACKGVGTNEKLLISVLMQRTKVQLQQLREAYKHKHGDLVKLVQSECSGNLQRVLTAGLFTDAELRAHLIHDGCSGPGTDEDTLIDCIMTAYPSQIVACRKEWDQHFKIMSFDTRVKFETGGNLQKALEAAMNPLRPEVGVDAGKMVDDLEVFYQATEGKVGTDEAAICRLIATRSRDHLLALNEAYKGRSPKHLNAVQVIIKETSGNLEAALVAAFSPPSFWHARRIHKACFGLGTNEKMLIRSLFLPDGREMKLIRDILQHENKQNLVTLMKKELSGHLEGAIVAYVEFWLR